MLRIEPERISVVIDASDVDASISAAPAASLLERIFDLAGLEAGLSNGGLIARQLITRLDGVQGARVFKIRRQQSRADASLFAIPRPEAQRRDRSF